MTIDQARMRILQIIKKDGIALYRIAKRIGISANTLNLFLLRGNTGSVTIEKIMYFLEYEYEKFKRELSK